MRTDNPLPRFAALRATGMSPETINARLMLEGWAIDDILEAQRSFISESASAGHSPEPTALRVSSTELPPSRTQIAITKHVTTALILIALFGLGAAGSSAYLYFKPAYVYSISIPAQSTTTPETLTYGALPALSDPAYYASVKQKLIAQNVSFIDANLSDMKLNVFLDGTSVLEVPIAAKGKVGSWWETPAGIYQIQTKETNHLSSIGDVYMPYSMQFQGNFFIHGWPYYEDGTPVSTSFSGGCIRLSTEDAQKVYDLARNGMPVLVYNTEAAGDSFNYQLKAPAITANAYLVADLTNGTVLASKNASSTAPIASITKLVTALVATEYINLDKKITVPASAIVYTSVSRLKAQTSVRAYDLLFLLLQESSNEAAETLASAVGRSQFVHYMNEKVKAIGLQQTLFTDPSGAKQDISTPEDLFGLLRYIYENRRFVFGITTGDFKDSAYGKPAFGKLNNFNIIKGESSPLLGGKVGETNDAGETYAGIFSVRVGKMDRPIAVIILGSKDAQKDVAKLVDFVSTTYAPGEATP